MAKLSSSARTPARQKSSTPQPQPAATAPGRQTRTTRGQSREPSEPPTPRRSGRNARGASVDSDAGATTRGRNSKTAAVANDLQTVAEDEHVDVVDDGNQAVDTFPEAEQDEEDADEQILRESGFSGEGRASLMSGTTAKTATTQQAFQMDPDLIVDSLKGLDTSSEELVELLLPADRRSRPLVWKDIATNGTRASKIYVKRLEILKTYKSDFALSISDYIHPVEVRRALANVADGEIPHNVPRPDSVIRKANLAYMLQSILIGARDPLDLSYESFTALENAEEFFASTVAADGNFREQDFHLALAIATQLAIKRIASSMEDPSFSAQGLALNTFFSNDDEDDDPEYEYRHASALGFDNLSEEQYGQYYEQVRTLVDQLKEPFADYSLLDRVTALNSVRAAHPWEGFIHHLVQYFENRKLALEHQIRQVGGIDALVHRVRAYVQADEEEKRLAQLRSSIGGAAQEQPSNFGDLGALKALASTSVAQAAVAQAPAPIAPMMPPVEPHDGSQIEVGDNVPAPVPDRPAADLHDVMAFQHHQRQYALGNNRGRSFNDPQQGAHRVSWDDSQSSQQPATHPGVQPPRSQIDPRLTANQNGKRPHEEEYQDFDPTQDDEQDFQNDVRDMSAADARRQTAPRAVQKPRSSAMRQNQNAGDAATAGPSGTQGTQDSPNKRQRRNPGSSIPDGIAATQEPPSGSRAWHQAKDLAKINRNFAREKKAPKQRIPWSAAEEDRLYELIAACDEDMPPSYSVLKNQDKNSQNILQHRDQEQMRFKARNMKVLMLESRQGLLGGWNSVVLDKKLIERLHSRGIDYYQQQIRSVPDREI